MDPEHAPAWAYLGIANTVDIGLRLTGEWKGDRLPEVLAQVRRAISLDPELAGGSRWRRHRRSVGLSRPHQGRIGELRCTRPEGFGAHGLKASFPGSADTLASRHVRATASRKAVKPAKAVVCKK